MSRTINRKSSKNTMSSSSLPSKTSSSSFVARQSSTNQPWIQRHYLKDGKIRSNERYYRSFIPQQQYGSSQLSFLSKNNIIDGNNNSFITIILDSVSWRKYLRLILYMIQNVKEQPQNNIKIHFILLESVVECMEYRNQSPCIIDNHDNNIDKQRKEVAAIQERSIIQKLLTQQINNESIISIHCFCDLLYRDEDIDEWYLYHYSKMNIIERTKQSIIRSVRLLHDIIITNTSLTSNGDNNNNQCEIWICMDDINDYIDIDLNDYEIKIQYYNMNEVINYTSHLLLLSEKDTNEWYDIKKSCDIEYNQRNYPKQQLQQNQDDNVEKIYNENDIRIGLINGTLYRGRLNVTIDNPKEAFVNVAANSNNKNMIYYINQKLNHFNKAFHHDIVIIEPLLQSQWGRPIGRRRISNNQNNNDNDDNDTVIIDTIDHNNITSIPSMPSARVVSIYQPSRRIIVATMIDIPSNYDDSIIYVIPMDIRYPKIRIKARQWRNYMNCRLKIHIDGWDTNSYYPYGHCIDIIGNIGDLETEINSLLIENQVNLLPFSLSALSNLPQQQEWMIPNNEIQGRKDLRKSRHIFSVDPPGCQDIDDTMHAEILPNGDIEVGVHIADVTYFVPHNSSLDIEAQERSTTFYLVDRRFDMLPALLSSNLCSLHDNVDRLAVSVIWIMSSDLTTIKSTWYGRTIIHNCAAMTYDQADNILHDKPPEDPNVPPPPPLTAGSPVNRTSITKLKRDLTILTQLGRKLKAHREDYGGAVDLSSGDTGNELKFTLDASGKPSKVAVKEVKEIHNTIAELMIMANSSVAQTIYKYFPESALLRIHRNVEEERLDDLREVLIASGLTLHGNDNKALAKSLKDAQKSTKSNVVKSLFNSIATRAMTEAQYICTGDKGSGEKTLLHYGLGLEFYTHFTSPIRRYADVVVHKQLLASLFIVNNPIPRESILQWNDTKSILKPLQSLPTSSVVSILSGEGISSDRDDDNIVNISDRVSALVIEDQPKIPHDEQNDASTTNDIQESECDNRSYNTKEVTTICEQLNLHNRLAKQSSFECQSLFLSLYFRDHIETTPAVVTQLRENGFWVYVPKFDIRGPVYLRDINNDIQIDPTLLGLPSDSGLPATTGFTSSSFCRRFMNGKSELIQDGMGNERLEVSVHGSKIFCVRPLDVVTILLSCDEWDVRARVPKPRFQLLSKLSERQTKIASTNSDRQTLTSSSLTKVKDNLPLKSSRPKDPDNVTMFDLISSIPIQPIIDAPLRRNTIQVSKNKTNNNENTDVVQQVFNGRFVYSNFINPDTRSYAQEEAQRLAASDTATRRAQVMEAAARRSEYSTTTTIERTVTLRQQRLAADKRNTRKSKAK